MSKHNPSADPIQTPTEPRQAKPTGGTVGSLLRQVPATVKKSSITQKK